MTARARRAPFAAVVAVVVAALCLAGPAASRARLTVEFRPIPIATHRIVSFPIKGNQVRFGPLTFIGGLELEGRDPDFGGLSGLEMLDGGRRMLSIADNAIWFSARVDYDGAGRPVGLADAGVKPMLGFGGRPMLDWDETDSEGLALSHDGGRPSLLVSFERDHRIARFPLDPDFRVTKPGVRMKAPGAIRRLRLNKGLEALAERPAAAGRAPLLVAIAERARNGKDDNPGWFRRNGKWSGFHIRKIGAFQATGAAFLPDGDLLLLERRFTLTDGVGMRIRRFRGGDFQKGAVLEGQILLEAGFTYQIDNMEGIAVHRNGRGETVVSVISDDNRSVLQRTLLLQFRYDDRRPAAKPAGLRGSTDG